MCGDSKCFSTLTQTTGEREARQEQANQIQHQKSISHPTKHHTISPAFVPFLCSFFSVILCFPFSSFFTSSSLRPLHTLPSTFPLVHTSSLQHGPRSPRHSSSSCSHAPQRRLLWLTPLAHHSHSRPHRHRPAPQL